MEQKVYVFLAEGFEEIEAVTPIDLLRRAGLNVETVSVTADRLVTGAHGVPYTADRVLADVEGQSPLPLYCRAVYPERKICMIRLLCSL